MRIRYWSSDVCSSDLQAFVAPLRRLPAGFAQYPAADADDVAGSLGVADEVVGPHFAQLPVLPADQGLGGDDAAALERSEEHTSELQSLMRISYAVFCLKKKK